MKAKLTEKNIRYDAFYDGTSYIIKATKNKGGPKAHLPRGDTTAGEGRRGSPRARGDTGRCKWKLARGDTERRTGLRGHPHTRGDTNMWMIYRARGDTGRQPPLRWQITRDASSSWIWRRPYERKEGDAESDE